MFRGSNSLFTGLSFLVVLVTIELCPLASARDCYWEVSGVAHDYDFDWVCNLTVLEITGIVIGVLICVTIPVAVCCHCMRRRRRGGKGGRVYLAGPAVPTTTVGNPPPYFAYAGQGHQMHVSHPNVVNSYPTPQNPMPMPPGDGMEYTYPAAYPIANKP